MKVALIGASGKVGQRLLKELTDRGHSVTAIARNPEKIPAAPNAGSTKDCVATAPTPASAQGTSVPTENQ